MTLTSKELEIKLTEKEIEVIQLIADGKSNKVIAELSGYRDSSVETVRARIYMKLGVPNGCACVAYALRNKLIV
jgi:DNA-binding NarL/FixJ family response regulator